MRFLMAACLFLIATQHSAAQHIKRKGGLGVGFFQHTPDSLVKKLNYKEGAVVQFIVPGTTAANLGLQVNDIITNINNIKIILPNEILAPAKNLREDDKIIITLLRNNKEIVFKGNVVARAKETSSAADVIYGEFAYKNGYVRTIYKAPKGKIPLGTVYFLQGLPCYSMDNFKELDITKLAIDAMVDRGFAVYRMEKADMGDNTNMAPCETMGFNDELDMYIAGYKNLLTLKEVDTAKIFLFGHSMGGLTAPLVAEIFQPKGVMVYGTVFKPWMDYLFDAYQLQSQYYGDDLGQLRDNVELMKPYIYDYFYYNKTEEEVCNEPVGRMAMETILGYDVKTKLAASGRSAKCHKELNQHNMAKAWGKTNGYVLAMYGECDIAAIHPDDHIALIDYVNKVHPGKGTFWLAPKSTHMFEEIGSMQEFIRWQATLNEYYKYASTKFNSKIFEYCCNWMKAVMGKG
ncbi:MAG: alpha/beta hydrolase [Ferruginibacter sp.]